MARPLRLQFPGAVYHITARGNRQEPIFEDDSDRGAFLGLLEREVTQQGWLLYAYCLMANHYHLLVETPEPNLVRGMRRLNGVYTQAFNRRHDRVGHVLQGRYKAILVDKQEYLLELCRYVVRNPVRAGIAQTAADWAWSSYLFTAGRKPCPEWLAADRVLELFGTDGVRARRAYARFVAEGPDSSSPWQQVRGQIFLGSDNFVAGMEKHIGAQQVSGIPRRQITPGRPNAQGVLRTVARDYGVDVDAVLNRSSRPAFKHTIYLLRRRANLPLKDVAQIAGVSIGRVSQIQREIESRQADERLTQLIRNL